MYLRQRACYVIEDTKRLVMKDNLNITLLQYLLRTLSMLCWSSGGFTSSPMSLIPKRSNCNNKELQQSDVSSSSFHKHICDFPCLCYFVESSIVTNIHRGYIYEWLNMLLHNDRHFGITMCVLKSEKVDSFLCSYALKDDRAIGYV